MSTGRISVSTDPCLILVLNSGSSSLKFAVYDTGSRTSLLSGLAERLGAENPAITFKDIDGKRVLPLGDAGHAAALDAVLAELSRRGWLGTLAAVGHRVVHGGERFTESTLITPEVISDIEACSALAPLHNPAAVLGIRVALGRLSDIPHVVVVDTAFHQTMKPEAYLYALPMSLYREQGVRRYGFHGTSHRFVAREAVTLLGLDPADHGLVIAHLGNGASATAVQDGCSVDTSMGMTPLEGLVMGTRCGDIDAGAVAVHHAHRRPRPGRDGRAAEQEKRAAGPVGTIQRLPRTGSGGGARTQGCARRARGVRTPVGAPRRRPGDGLTPARCGGVHRWHRREFGAGAGDDIGAVASARPRAGRRCQRSHDRRGRGRDQWPRRDPARGSGGHQ